MYQAKCPSCQTVLEYLAQQAGLVVVCPKCSGQFKLPAVVQTGIPVTTIQAKVRAPAKPTNPFEFNAPNVADDDEPELTIYRQGSQETAGFAIASLVLGLVGAATVCFAFPL